MVNCWFCNETMIWDNDFEPIDIGMAGEGVVSMLHCKSESCDCNAYFIKTTE